MGRAHETIRMKVAEVIRQCLLRALDSVTETHPSPIVRWRCEELRSLVTSLEVYDVLIRNELPAGQGFIDMDVLGRIIFELKSEIREFKVGEKKIQEKYLPFHKDARWAIITNFNVWNFYKVEDGKLGIVEQGISLKEAKEKLFSIFLDELAQDLRLAPSQSTITVLFKDVAEYEERLLEIFRRVKNDEIVKPLFEAYRTIIVTLYGKAGEEFYESLFVKHTILQMIVSACLSSALLESCSPVEACSGVRIPVEIALPYLNWWYIILNKLDCSYREFLDKLTSRIYTKSQLLNWKTGGVEDAFRELYELLVDSETRRKLGEYYTPLWVVDLLVKRVKEYSGTFSRKLVVDPFCGSGTFLVKTFHTKVGEGQDPEEAIKEVIGFDINPLAVSIARAELMLAYRRYRDEPATPLIFHSDTIAVMLDIGIPEFYDIFEVREIKKLVDNFISEFRFSMNRIKPQDLADLLRIEMMLREILESFLQDEKRFIEILAQWKSYSWSELGKSFISSLEENSDAWEKLIEGLVKKYGNGVWSVAISSLIAPMVVSSIGADIVITNPPWQQLPEVSVTYRERISKVAQRLVRYIGIPTNKVSNVVQGSDLATIALLGGIKWCKGVIGYVMPRESSFCVKFRQRAGLILTYAVIKSNAIEHGELIDLDYDAFEHGNYPSLVILKRGEQK